MPRAKKRMTAGAVAGAILWLLWLFMGCGVDSLEVDSVKRHTQPLDPPYRIVSGKRVTPPHRMNFCMAQLGGRVYAFGGRISGGYGGQFNRSDTSFWVFDNGQWAPVSTPTAPPWRQDCALARFGQALYLFGGHVPPAPVGSTTYLKDFWRFDGTTWTNLTTSSGPAPRSRAVLGALTVSGTERLFLFGGDGPSTSFNDTWEWTGTGWTQLSPTITPASGGASAQGGYSYAAEPFQNKLIMYGNGTDDQIWEFDGTSWVGRRPTNRPAARNLPSLAVVGAAVYVFGGNVSSMMRDELWEWNGTAWRRLTLSTSPHPRDSAAAVTQNGKLFLHGGRFGSGSNTQGTGDTWEFDGTSWTELSPAPSAHPFGIKGHAMVSMGTDVLLVGGFSLPFSSVAQTWRKRNGTWERLSPTTSPPERSYHAMVASGTSAILFGGRTTSMMPLGDTWEWNGTTWAQLTPATAPSPRFGHSLTLDGQGNAILFGGSNGTTVLSDTWLWNGSSWVQQNPSTSPPARYLHGAGVFNGHVMIFGGTDSTMSGLQDAWEWTGTTWQQLTPASPITTWSARASSAVQVPEGLVFFNEWTGSGGQSAHIWDGTGFFPYVIQAPAEQDSFSFMYGPVVNSPDGLVIVGGGWASTSVTFPMVEWVIRPTQPDGGVSPGDGGTPSQDGGAALDGGIPTQDGGTPSQDGGTALDGGIPAQDGGTPSQDGGAALDGGIPTQDGGTPSQDGGTALDGGIPAQDGGTPSEDGGTALDGGILAQDGGIASEDGGTALDGGTSPQDGGTTPDGGSETPMGAQGCSCGATAPGAWQVVGFVVLGLLRRRRLRFR